LGDQEFDTGLACVAGAADDEETHDEGDGEMGGLGDGAKIVRESKGQ
jgi:hypothetical protein